MTLQQKIPLYNFFIATTLFFLISISSFFIFSSKINAVCGIVIICFSFIVFYVFRKLRLDVSAKMHGEFDRIDEKINLLKGSIDEKSKVLKILPHTREKVSFLFNISQGLIELIDADEIFDLLTNTLGDLFPQAENILFFDFDKEENTVGLIRSFKRKDSVIKEKKGDVLDRWVLRQNQSLLIEDIINDFRFDYTNIVAYNDRSSRSFIVSPLAIGHKFLGLIRLESKRISDFSLDDLRLLRNICDIAAVVLEKARLLRSAQDLATKDSLTSLFLRDYFYERIEAELKRAQTNNTKVGIIMLDIDNFKNINDKQGHIVGDFVLSKLSRILINSVKSEGNVISRFGGEEFIIFLIESSKDEALRLAELIRKTVEQTILTFRRKKITFTISLGVVLYPDDGNDFTALLEKVDKLLYKAKKKGKNRVCSAG